MKKIEFSYNWNNKLNCKMFTTFRMANQEKYREGEEYLIVLKGKIISKAICRGIYELFLNEVNEQIASLDTGYNLQEFKKIIGRMYPNVKPLSQKWHWIFLENIERAEMIPDPSGVDCGERVEFVKFKL